MAESRQRYDRVCFRYIKSHDSFELAAAHKMLKDGLLAKGRGGCGDVGTARLLWAIGKLLKEKGL